LSRFSINLQEDGLGEILGFRGISQNVQSGHVNKAMVPLENHCERIGITGLKVPHYTPHHRAWGVPHTTHGRRTAGTSFVEDTWQRGRSCIPHERTKDHAGKLFS
jgi:hypothetical protein